MAYSTTVKTRRDGSITLKDGTSPAKVTLVVAYEGDGNFTYSDTVADRVVIYDRGAIVGLRKGNNSIQSGSFSIAMRQFTDTPQAGSVIDFINKTGKYSTNNSSGGNAFKFYTVDIHLVVEGTDHGDASDHEVTLSNCLCTYDFSEGEQNSFTINFECYGGISRS